MMKRRDILNVRSRMQAAVWHLVSLFVLLFLTTSCNREPLELYKSGDSMVTISYDWTYYNGPQPNGIFVMFAHNGDSITKSYATHDLTGETNEQMAKGTYKQLVMTNTFQEYLGNMRFFYTDSYEKMMAISNTYNITDMNAWDTGRQYLVEPMHMGVAVDSFDVKTDYDGLVFYEYDKDAGADTLHQERRDTIRSMVTTLTIRVKVRGINYVSSPEFGGVDGYITGMADGFYLSQQWRRSEVSDIKLNHWRFDGYDTSASPRRADGDDNEYKVGWIVTDIQTFGLPHGRELLCQRTEKSNYLKLHFTRLNGETIDFDYDVGKMIRYEGDDGTPNLSFKLTDVALQLDLEIDANTVGEDDVPTIPYTQPSGTGSFDAEVEPWGDDVNVDVQM